MVFLINSGAKNPPLRQYPKRYRQPLPNDRATINGQTKTKNQANPPPDKILTLKRLREFEQFTAINLAKYQHTSSTCRLIIEGMLSFEQTGFNSFSIKPQLSDKLPYISLKNLHIGNNKVSLHMKLIDGFVQTKIHLNGTKYLDRKIIMGEKLEINM